MRLHMPARKLRWFAALSLALCLTLFLAPTRSTAYIAPYDVIRIYTDDYLRNDWHPFTNGEFSPFGTNTCSTIWRRSPIFEPGIPDGWTTYDRQCNGNQTIIAIDIYTSQPMVLREVSMHWQFGADIDPAQWNLGTAQIAIRNGSGPISISSEFSSYSGYATYYDTVPPNAFNTFTRIWLRVKVSDAFTGTSSPILSYVRLGMDYEGVTPTPYATNTYLPTWTPRPTSTGSPYPTSTPYPTYTLPATWTPGPSPTGPTRTQTQPPVAITRQAPALTPLATLDTCDRSNLAIPCITPSAVWSTLVLPTLNLPSPTRYPTQASPTPRIVTAVPSPTISPTPPVGASVTPMGTPIGNVLNQPGIDTSGFERLNEFTRDTFATFMPLSEISFDVNGTPTGLQQVFQKFGAAAAQPIRIVRSFENTDLNRGAGFVTWIIFLFIIWVITEAFCFLLPIVLTIVKWIMDLIQTVKPF